MAINKKAVSTIAVLVVLAAAITFAVQGRNRTDAPQANTPQDSSPAAVTQENAIYVSQSVQGSNLNTPGPVRAAKDSTALALLKSTHQVQVKDFAGSGEFVTSIDGMEQDSGRFWAFYVNGSQAPVGAGQYQLKEGDRIEWKLEEIRN